MIELLKNEGVAKLYNSEWTQAGTAKCNKPVAGEDVDNYVYVFYMAEKAATNDAGKNDALISWCRCSGNR